MKISVNLTYTGLSTCLRDFRKVFSSLFGHCLSVYVNPTIVIFIYTSTFVETSTPKTKVLGRYFFYKYFVIEKGNTVLVN